MHVIKTTPFKTAIPHKAIKPTDAGTERYSPVTARPNTPPIAEWQNSNNHSGIAN